MKNKWYVPQILQLQKIDSNHHDINRPIVKYSDGDREMTIGITNITEDSDNIDKFNFESWTNYLEEVHTQTQNMMRPMPFSGYPFQGKNIRISYFLKAN